MILLAAILILTAATVASKGNGKLDENSRVWVSSAFHTEPGCLPSVKAITYYRRSYTRSRNAMNLSGAVPRVWYQQCASLRTRAKVWREKAKGARVELAAWKRDQYAWERWLPAKWYRVARCETGVNWSHDSGTYVSAFGIFRPGYADDAARVGNMSWDETIRVRGTVPTPREQYEAALSHYRAHGGFSGWGCRGA